MKNYVNPVLSVTDHLIAVLDSYDEDTASIAAIAINHMQVEAFEKFITSTVFLCAATLLDIANKKDLNAQLQSGYKFGSLILLNAVPEIVGRIQDGAPKDSGESAYIAGFKRIFHHNINELDYVIDSPQHGANNLAKLMYLTLRCNIAHKSILSNIFVLDKYPENLRFDKETNKINIATGVWYGWNLAYFVALIEDMKKNVGFDSERWINLLRVQHDENEKALRILNEIVNWHAKNK